MLVRLAIVFTPPLLSSPCRVRVGRTLRRDKPRAG
jgi:hypothetical protein